MSKAAMLILRITQMVIVAWLVYACWAISVHT